MKCDFIIICKAPPLHHHYLDLSRSHLGLLFFSFFKKIFLIGESLLYNVLLVSAVQQHESAISIHISSHS